MNLRLLQDTNVKDKTVLYRSPYDIGVKEVNGKLIVKDDSRIRATLLTLKYLLEQNCKIIILTWVKRPEGIVNEKLRTIPHAKRLAELLNHPVKHVSDCVGLVVDKAVSQMSSKDILMLENTRFHKEEFIDDDNFAKKLTKNADLIVFDAFPQAHRVHASTTGILRHLPSCAGFYLEKEVKELSSLSDNSSDPFTLIMGGAKVSDKIPAIENLIDKTDHVLLGGAVANVFLKASGVDVAGSFVEDIFVNQSKKEKLDCVEAAKKLLDKYKEKIILPTDTVVADSIENPTEILTINDMLEGVLQNWAILDIGPKTVESFKGIIQKSKTVFWNGPMGMFEDGRFEKGTKAISESISDLPSNTLTVVSGGDTVEAIHKFGVSKNISHISLAGGATLEFLSGKTLPALRMLAE